MICQAIEYICMNLNFPQMKELVMKLHDERRLEACEYRSLLLCEDRSVIESLHEAARETAVRKFGRNIYIRGLVEITNICRNDCLYCGIRKSNGNIPRYLLAEDEVLGCCRNGYSLGFRTFVLQGGELPESSDGMIERLCRKISGEFPDCALTLSLGERSEDSYRRFREAGASRYLLRHETIDPGHYSMLHPERMSLENRLHCLHLLKKYGYQAGTGIMVGSPFQSVGNIVGDIIFIGEYQPEMIGLGPFIPHRDTVFACYWKSPASILPGKTHEEEAMDLTLKLISIFRLMLPDSLIPATTALATLSSDGHEKGILAGANVIMPNLSPPAVRGSYSLYDSKASSGAEAAEGLDELKLQLDSIGYKMTADRGDFTAS